MDPILNCLTGTCCPPAQRRIVMTKALMEYCQCDHATAEKVGGWILDTFDLAPAGKLLPLIQEIARLARNNERA